jgi:dipeptidyl aminopeptidase/acylaminoacyl peptidase
MFASILALAAALPPPAPISPADLLGVTDISGLSLSPDSRWLAFRTERPSTATNRVETHWWVAPSDGSAPARIVADGGAAEWTGAGVVRIERPVWLDDSRHFAFRAARDGEIQAWIADISNGSSFKATAFDGDVLAIGRGQADAPGLSFAVGPSRNAIESAEQAIRDNGALVDSSIDLAVGVVGGVLSPFGAKSVRLTGDWFGRRDLLAETSHRYFQRGQGGSVTPSIAGPAVRDFVLPDPALQAAICKAVDCVTNRVEAIVPIRGRAELLVTTADRGERQTLNLWDGTRLTPIFRGDGLVSGARVQYEPCAVATARVYCVLASANQPPRLASIDLATGAAETLFDPNGELRRRTVGRVKALAWSDAQNHRFEAQLYLPTRRRPENGFPLVIQYYWCDGFVRGGQGEELPFFSLADAGIAALCINRSLGNSKSAGDPRELKIAQSGIETILARLSRDGVADPARVGMQGLSFGSQATMWMASHTRVLRAAAIASGQLEPSSYWFYADKGRDFTKVLAEAYSLGDPVATAKAWRTSSPSLLPDVPMPPMLMQLPESEARWSMQLFRRLQSKTPLQLYAFPDAAHVKSAPRQLLATGTRNLAWFRFWLQGVSDSDTSEPGRNARWTALADAFENTVPAAR